MCSRSIEYNGVKYMEIINNRELKLKSLEDNLFCKLNDIYFNIDNLDYTEEADYFNLILTNGITFPQRTESFHYSNIIHNKLYLREIIKFLKNISESDFYFDIIQPYEFITLDDYLEFNIWIKELNDLVSILESKLKEF